MRNKFFLSTLLLDKKRSWPHGYPAIQPQISTSGLPFFLQYNVKVSILHPTNKKFQALVHTSQKNPSLNFISVITTKLINQCLFFGRSIFFNKIYSKMLELQKLEAFLWRVFTSAYINNKSTISSHKFSPITINSFFVA